MRMRSIIQTLGAACVLTGCLAGTAAAFQADVSERVMQEITIARRLELEGDLQGAIGRLWPLFRQDPGESSLFLTLHRLLVQTGDDLRIERLLEARLARLPGDRRALALLGDLRHRQGRGEEAMGMWESIPSAATGDLDSWLTAAMHMQGVGAYEAALRTYRQGREYLSAPTLFTVQVVQALGATGRGVEAYSELLDWVSAEPGALGPAETTFNLLAVDRDDIQALDAVLGAWIGGAAEPAALLRLHGRLLMTMGAWEQALGPMREADRRYRAGGGVLAEVARRAEVVGDTRGALLAWEAVLEYGAEGGTRFAALEGAATAAAAAEEFEKALSHHLALVEEAGRRSGWERYAHRLAETARAAGRLRLARSTLERLAAEAALPADRISARIGLAALALQEGRAAEALDSYRRAAADVEVEAGAKPGLDVRLRPLLERARIGEAYALLLTGEELEGVELLVATVSAVPGVEGASEALELAARLRIVSTGAPDLASAYAAARASLHAGDAADAARRLEGLLAVASGRALEEVRLSLAQARAAQGDTSAAIDLCEEAAGDEGGIRQDEALLIGARFLLAVGRGGEAVRWLDHLLTGWPDGVHAPQARRLLAGGTGR